MRLLNADGVVIGGENVTLEADALTGDGQLLSLGDMTIHTQQSFNNAGDVIANGSMTFTTPGSVTNSGNLLAGAKLISAPPACSMPLPARLPPARPADPLLKPE